MSNIYIASILSYVEMRKNWTFSGYITRSKMLISDIFSTDFA